MKKFRQYYQKKPSLLICITVILTVTVIIGAVFAIYIARTYYIKSKGIQLKASMDHEAKSIQYYLQSDPEWASENIGASSRQIGGAGCLITCVASAITDLGVVATPKDVNAKLTEVGGYQTADLIWYKINEAFAKIDYKYSRVFSSATIDNDLKAGLLPIVNVKINGNGATHWLLIIGAKNGEFLAFDPLNKDREPINLSKHGNVYAYRVLVPA